MQQTGSFSMTFRQAQIIFEKFLGAGNADYRMGRGWWDCRAWVKCDIYDCLVTISVFLHMPRTAET